MGFFGNINKEQDALAMQHGQPDSQSLLLMQQRASVDYLQAMVKTGRGDAVELANAERRLNELQGLKEVIGAECRVPASEVKLAASKYITADKSVLDSFKASDDLNIMLLKKELMNVIDSLMRQRAEASNAMHAVPYNQPCPELMAKALELHEQVENAWTKYRYLERNGKLPEIETPQTRQNSLELLQKMDDRKKLAEKRSKLKKKLEDPLNIKHKKREEWQEEYDFSLLEIKRLDDDIYLLKNR